MFLNSCSSISHICYAVNNKIQKFATFFNVMGIVQRIKDLGREKGYTSLAQIEKAAGLKDRTLYRWDKNEPAIEKVKMVAVALNASSDYILGLTDDRYSDNLKAPGITEEYVSFPVLGEVAAGYDHLGYEDWTGDTLDIPASYLKGRPREDFFVLRVVGQSMFPTYQHGDCVFIQRADTLSRSGEIGVVLYDDEQMTLKRVEYVEGEDWLRLVPINPQVPPETIEGERLEHCRILGIPKLLIRDIDG